MHCKVARIELKLGDVRRTTGVVCEARLGATGGDSSSLDSLSFHSIVFSMPLPPLSVISSPKIARTRCRFVSSAWRHSDPYLVTYPHGSGVVGEEFRFSGAVASGIVEVRAAGSVVGRNDRRDGSGGGGGGALLAATVIPVARLPENQPVQQWYLLKPPPHQPNLKSVRRPFNLRNAEREFPAYLFLRGSVGVCTSIGSASLLPFFPSSLQRFSLSRTA